MRTMVKDNSAANIKTHLKDKSLDHFCMITMRDKFRSCCQSISIRVSTNESRSDTSTLFQSCIKVYFPCYGLYGEGEMNGFLRKNGSLWRLFLTDHFGSFAQKNFIRGLTMGTPYQLEITNGE